MVSVINRPSGRFFTIDVPFWLQISYINDKTPVYLTLEVYLAKPETGIHTDISHDGKSVFFKNMCLKEPF
jgi:hypothetical protein